MGRNEDWKSPGLLKCDLLFLWFLLLANIFTLGRPQFELRAKRRDCLCCLAQRRSAMAKLFVTVAAVAINMHNISAKLAPSLFSDLTNLGPNLQERGWGGSFNVSTSLSKLEIWVTCRTKVDGNLGFFVMRYGGISNNRPEKWVISSCSWNHSLPKRPTFRLTVQTS